MKYNAKEYNTYDTTKYLCRKTTIIEIEKPYGRLAYIEGRVIEVVDDSFEYHLIIENDNFIELEND